MLGLEWGWIGQPNVFQNVSLVDPKNRPAHSAQDLDACTTCPVQAIADASLRFKVVRSLVVSEVSGSVSLLRGDLREAAQEGQTLQLVGEAIETGSNARAVLMLDTQAGTIELSPNTLLRIQTMVVSDRGGYHTQLFLERGQAKVKVKKFLNPDSTLEIHTPAGVSGVRGTAFGMTVQPNGDTGVSTQEGTVLVTGQDQSVELPAGYQTLLRRGRTPESVKILKDSPTLRLRWLTQTQGKALHFAGQVDPNNLLLINQQPYGLDPQGNFDLMLPLAVSPARPPIIAIVITPLGQQQRYELAIP
jgi:hypothetical protein